MGKPAPCLSFLWPSLSLAQTRGLNVGYSCLRTIGGDIRACRGPKHLLSSSMHVSGLWSLGHCLKFPSLEIRRSVLSCLIAEKKPLGERHYKDSGPISQILTKRYECLGQTRHSYEVPLDEVCLGRRCLGADFTGDSLPRGLQRLTRIPGATYSIAGPPPSLRERSDLCSVFNLLGLGTPWQNRVPAAH